MKNLELNQDGIKLYGYNNDIIYFDDWLKQATSWGIGQDDIRAFMISNGYLENSIDEKIEELEEEFYEYCSIYDYSGEII